MRINQREYAWGDVQIIIFGQPVAGCRGVDYKTKKEKELLFGAGRSARAIQHKRREVDGSVTILQSELQALNRSAKANGYKDILDVDFDIIVSYMSEGGIVTIDRIVCASISEMPHGMKEGDGNSEHVLPFVALDVEYGS
ncbi:MAG: hypothetical protein RRZ64_07985 [Rikenellaceae bacterium]